MYGGFYPLYQAKMLKYSINFKKDKDMRTIKQTTPVTGTGPLAPITLNFDNTNQQLNTYVALNGFAGAYTLEGNLGMIETAPGQFYTPSTLGQVVPDPAGWYVISGAAPLTTAKQIGDGQLSDFKPMAFIRANVTTFTTAGELILSVLQQGIR